MSGRGTAGAVVRGHIGGVAVVVAQQPGARAVAATSSRSAGTTSERQGEAGYAHLAEHLVHQYARTATADLVDEVHSSAGGVSNAQTYPFHTEFTFVVPVDAVDESPAWFGSANARLRWPDVGDAEVESERAVVEQEVTHRLGSSPIAGFPWIDALGTLSDDAGMAHDGFADLTDVRTATAGALRGFWERTGATASTAVALVTPWAPSEVADRLGVVDGPTAGAEFRPDLTGPRHRTPSVPTRVPVRAEVRWLPDAPDQPRERSRALAILAARTLDLTDPDGRWQSGLFGACLGPDHGVVIRSTTARAAALRLPSQVGGARVEDARRTALTDLDHVFASTATYSALLSRDAVYGLDPAVTREHLRTLPHAAVLDVLDLLAMTEPGHLGTPALVDGVHA